MGGDIVKGGFSKNRPTNYIKEVHFPPYKIRFKIIHNEFKVFVIGFTMKYWKTQILAKGVFDLNG